MKYLILALVTLAVASCTCQFKDDTSFGVRSGFKMTEESTE